jgi:hypothetical protein
LSTHLHLGLPSGLFSFCFTTSILYAFLFSNIHAIFPAHLILLELHLYMGVKKYTVVSNYLFCENLK